MIIHGDCLTVLPTLKPNSVDACCTDPPYNLATMTARCGNGSAPITHQVHHRTAAGFMGKKWDTAIAFDPETWKLVYDVLKPGAHLIALGGDRTHHRMWTAIEDAGFEIRQSMVWVYGTGFPKNRNLGDGWGSALKPAIEMICLARKPISESSVAANMQRHGVGGLNIDGCRVPAPDAVSLAKNWERPMTTDIRGGKFYSGGSTPSAIPRTATASPQGRWPANLLHDGSDVVLAGFPDSKAKTSSSSSARAEGRIFGGAQSNWSQGSSYGDDGSAARFFYCAKPSVSEREIGLNDQSATETSRRCTHPTVKPLALISYLTKLITPIGGTVLDPFAGSGTTGMACAVNGYEFIGIELESEYVGIAEKRIAAVSLPDWLV